MTDLFDNPMGLNGFEFVEYAAPERGILEPAFAMMGFSHVASHRSKDVDLWRQGDINFIINYEKNAPALVQDRRARRDAHGRAVPRALDERAGPGARGG